MEDINNKSDELNEQDEPINKEIIQEHKKYLEKMRKENKEIL